MVVLNKFGFAAKIFEEASSIAKGNCVLVKGADSLNEVASDVKYCRVAGLERRVFIPHLLNQDRVLADFLLDLGQFFLVNLDKFQVLTSDVVVVHFHLAECLLVVDHELVDVLIFALLNLVDFDFHAEGEFFFEEDEFAVVVFNKAFLTVFEFLLKIFQTNL